MEFFEQKIRHRLSSDQLIGCYFTKGKEQGFKDIRGNEGQPVDGLDDQIVTYDGKKLIEGEYYSFNWTVPKGTNTIKITGDVTQVNKDAFLDTLFNFHMNAKGGMLQLAISSQETTLEEVTGSSHTFLYELLQNANDYPYNKELVKVKFILTEHYLFFFHTGAEFSLRNIAALCTIRQGEKRKNTETIGYKGIGFKTVFVKNEYVFLESGDWHFRFDREYSEKLMFGKCAWTMMPIKTEVAELDEEARAAIQAAGKEYRVKFALRHKSDAGENLIQIDKVFADDQILLFIPNLDSVEIIVPNRKTRLVKKDSDKWEIGKYPYRIPAELKKWVAEDIKNGGKVPPKFIEIENIHISFAVPKEGRYIYPLKEARVYNYLPTDLNIGLGALINADFIPNASRNGLHDVEWNDHVMKEVGRKYVTWWASLFETGKELDLNSVMDLIPSFSLAGQYPKDFKKGFDEAIKEESCVPTLLHKNYSIKPLDETVFDEIGLTIGEDAAFSDDEFYALTGINKALPHQEIRQNPKLRRIYKDYPDKGQRFGITKLCSCIRQLEMQQWLRVKSNNIRFLRFLVKRDLLSHVCSENVFLSSAGNLCKAGQLYLDIDEYIDDIGFLPEELIQRLDTEVREVLSQEANWPHFVGNFKKFNATMFVKGFDWNAIQQLLKVKKNSVGMVHYMAKHVEIFSLPSNYPLFTDTEEILPLSEKVYIPSDFGKTVRAQNWFTVEDMPFIAEEYLARDADSVISYLAKPGHNIHIVNSSTFYDDFLQNDTWMKLTSKKLQDFQNNKSFYLFLSKIKDLDIRFTPKMREVFELCCTDGVEEYYLTVGKPIYFQDDLWKVGRMESWIPTHCCSAISDSYYSGLPTVEKEELELFFKSKQLVQPFTIAEFSRREIIPRIDDICETIETREQSCSFLDFLFTNRKSIFGNHQPGNDFHQIPVFCEGKENATSRHELKTGIYFHEPEIDELLAQPWFSAFKVPILESFYNRLFDGAERIAFYQSLGFAKFSLLPVLNRVVFSKIDSLSDILSDRDTNLAFHRYFCDRRSIFPEKELKTLQKAPIFLFSATDPLGVMDDTANDHYLPSKELTEIINADIIPIDLLDSIHPDYIQTEEDLNYYGAVLENVALNTDQFIDYICDNEDEVAEYLQTNPERNIRFWRWASKAKSEKKAKLRAFPILGHRFEEENDIFTKAELLSLSNKYSSIPNFESVVHRFNSSALFVSEKYLDDDDIRKWVTLFKAIRVTTEDKDLVFNRIIPHLDELKMTEIIPMIARYTDEIANRLRNEDEELASDLKELQLLCVDTEYRPIQEVIISGKYLGIDALPISDIRIDNLISEDYLTQATESNESTLQVKSFIKLLAGQFKNSIDTLTELRAYQLKSYLDNQLYYLQDARECHFRTMGYLADEITKDPAGINKILQNEHLLLSTDADTVEDASKLYLGTSYSPNCDFEGNGVESLQYVSGKYLDYSPNMVGFLTSWNVGVQQDFKTENLTLLTNEPFAYYFWTEYAPKNQYSLDSFLDEEHLRDLPCIPTIQGIRRPMDLYDYRVGDLKKMVLAINANEASASLPSVELPAWMSSTKIGFRSKLYVEDCLSYLALNNLNYRRNVYKWLVECDENIIESNHAIIESYKKIALWYNGKKEWVNLSDLVALEWNNKTLRDYFGSNEAVCNPSYMPEERHAYDRLCDIFGIKRITNDDFKKNKNGDRDEKAISEIGKRLLYVAYKTDSENWESLHDSYMKILDEADISSCTSIEYTYDERISTKMKAYSEEDDCLWYVGTWNGPLFGRVLDWLKRVLKLSSDKALLENVFLDDYNDILNSYEDSLPEELLKRLSEQERKGIKVSSKEEVEEYSDELDEDSHIETTERPSSTYQPTTRRAEQRDEDEIDEDEFDEEETEEETEDYNWRDKWKRDNPEKKRAEERRKQEERKKQDDDLRKMKQSQQTDQDELPLTHKQKIYSVEETFDKPASIKVSPTRKQEPRSKQDDAAELERIKEERDEKERLLQIASDESKRYTYEWFDALLEMEFNASGEENRSKRGIEINFSRVEKDPYSEHGVLLKNPSRHIPMAIEEMSNIPVTFRLSNDIHITIVFEVASAQDYVLRLKCKNEDIETVDNLLSLSREIYRAELKTATPVQLIAKLQEAFFDLQLEDDYNMLENINPTIKFIFGPPGTGKTTHIVKNWINQIATEPRGKMLILCPTNKAADVVAQKAFALLDPESQPENWLFRFVASNEDSLQNHICMREDEVWDADKCCIISTIARFPYDGFDDAKLNEIDWDYVVIDEASMIPLAQIIYPIYKCTNAQIVIAGDPLQIEPIVHEEMWKDENIYKMVGLQSFTNPVTRPVQFSITNLSTQYRSIPAIGDLFSLYAYDGGVQSARLQTSQEKLILGEFVPKSVNFVTFTVERMQSIYSAQQVNGSNVHIYSALFAFEFVKYISRCVEKKSDGKPWKIGVVSPYRAQAEIVNKLWEQRDETTPNAEVSIGTVHGFQGDQCDIIIAVYNPPVSGMSRVPDKTFVNKKNILNVAISRAQDYLFVLTPDPDYEFFNSLEAKTVGYIASHEHREEFVQINAQEMEKTMFDDENYLFNNTFVTTHQLANVYTAPSSKYEVRIDDKSIDIQIK